MLVKMKSTIAGPLWNASPEQIIDVPDDVGVGLIDGGFAVSVVPHIESASIAAPEQAVLPKPTRKRGK